MTAAEGISGRSMVAIERFEIPLTLVTRETAIECVEHLRPKCHCLRISHEAQKLSCVTTMSPPLFLLPANKSRRAVGDLVANGIRNLIPMTIATDTFRASELGVELLMSTAISNTPGANPVRELFHGVDMTSVDIASCLSTTNTRL